MPKQGKGCHKHSWQICDISSAPRVGICFVLTNSAPFVRSVARCPTTRVAPLHLRRPMNHIWFCNNLCPLPLRELPWHPIVHGLSPLWRRFSKYPFPQSGISHPCAGMSSLASLASLCVTLSAPQRGKMFIKCSACPSWYYGPQSNVECTTPRS